MTRPDFRICPPRGAAPRPEPKLSDSDRALVRGCAAAHLWADAMRENNPDESGMDSHEAEFLAEQLADALADGGDTAPWTASAIDSVRDVLDWASANVADVELYSATVDRDYEAIGHDFALSRGGHGTGLWDRGAGDVGDRLHKAASVYGSWNPQVSEDTDGEITSIDG